MVLRRCNKLNEEAPRVPAAIKKNKEKMMDQRLTALAKQKAFELGADLVGVGNIERWAAAPPLMSPSGIMPDGRAVLVCAIHHTDAMIEIGGEGSPHEQGSYTYQYFMNNHLDVISYAMGKFFEDLGYRAVPITASNIWRYREYKGLKAIFAPDMSHIYASVAAGLTELGFSGLAMSPEYGPRNRFVSIITDAPLVPDPLLPGGTLCDNCGQCVEHCATEAFSKEVKGEVAIEIEGRSYSRCNKNLWRCAWSEHFGLDCEAPIPEKVDEEAILEKIKEIGMRGGTMGCCLKYCLPRDKRSWNKDYSSAPIRKKSVVPARPAPDRNVQESILSNALSYGADMLSVQSAADWEAKGFDLKPLLPDVKSIVLFAVKRPSTVSASDNKLVALGDRMGYVMNKCAFYTAATLEKLGYSGAPYSMSGLKKDPGKTALENVKNQWSAAVNDPTAVLGFTLTSAELTPTERCAVYGSKPAALDSKETIRKLALELGADVVGFSSAKRLTDAINSSRSALDGERILNAREVGALWLNSLAEITESQRQVQVPADYLADAKSVIVLGVRIPKESSDCLGRHDAEAIGPYAFAQHQSHRTLGSAALPLTKTLEGWGFKCVAVNDLANTGSWISNPRGAFPNIFANRLAALCAGLGTITKGGFINNPQFGTNLRYVAIITDADLAEDPLADLHGLRTKCENCDRCLTHCSVKAYKGDASVQVDGHFLKFGIVEQARCDWALRYGLVADEGQKLTGATTNVLPPEKITKEALSDALAQRDPIVRIRPCVAEMCAMACPYTRSQEP
jgi:epoxyqueuosine reductase QueG